MESDFLLGLLNIMVINLVLSGDNAVVIAMASMNLPEKQRKKAVTWGTAGAIILRVILTIVAVYLLKIPLIQAIGGLLLAWIAVQLLMPEDHGGDDLEGSADFWKALRTIIWADFLMSLDNVLAVAGAAQGNFTLLILGLVTSIPIIMLGSTLLAKLMQRYPVLVYVGSGILAWTAGEMITKDQIVAPYIHNLHLPEILVPVVLTLVVLVVGYFLRQRKVTGDDPT